MDAVLFVRDGGTDSLWTSEVGYADVGQGFTFAKPEGTPTKGVTEGLAAVKLRSADYFLFNLDINPSQRP